MPSVHIVTVRTWLTRDECDELHHAAAHLKLPVPKYMHLMLKRHIQPILPPAMQDVVALHSDLIWYALLLHYALERGRGLEEPAARIRETQALLQSKIREV